MRKNKNNQRQELIRMHKTPSPSSFAEIKSPKFGRNANKAQQPNLKNQQKEQQKFDVFKAYLLQLKDKQSGITDENIENKHKRNTRQQHTRNQTSPNIDSNPYSLGNQMQSKILQKKLKNQQSDREVSRKTSVSRQGSDSGHPVRNSYQETIRKLANENIRLRHECKVMQQKFEKMVQQRKNMGVENGTLKLEVQRLSKINEQSSRKQVGLTQQIKNMKKALTTNSEQLSQSNYEIYKMKQQIFELKLTIQKLDSKKHSKSHSHNQKPFSSQKHLISPPPPPQLSPSPSSYCKQCKQNTLTIIQLTNRFENTKLQLGQKTSIVSSLCSQINRLQGELKLLEKPRLLYKKYNSIICQLNHDILNEKAKELSYKYMKVGK